MEQLPIMAFPEKLAHTMEFFGMCGGSDLILKNHNENYALYETELGFGFTHALELSVLLIEGKSGSLIQCKTLSGNSWGNGSWLLVNTKYFRDWTHFFDVIAEKTYIPKGKRKPQLLRSLTDEEVFDFLVKNEWRTQEEINTMKEN